MWILGSIACALNVIAVGKLDLWILAAPLQLFLFNVAIVAAILLGKQKFQLAKRKKRSRR